MDYLPLPDGINAKHLRVPFLATKKLGANDLFSDFGRKHFCSYPASNRSDVERQLGDILQSWLYFGLLAEVLGEELDPAEFKSTDESGESYVELKSLRKSINKLIETKSLGRGAWPHADIEDVVSDTVEFQADTFASGALPSSPVDQSATGVFAAAAAAAADGDAVYELTEIATDTHRELPSSSVALGASATIEQGDAASDGSPQSSTTVVRAAALIAKIPRPKRRYNLTLQDCLSRCERELTSFESSIIKFNSPLIDAIVLSIEVLVASLGRARTCEMKPMERNMSPSARCIKRQMIGLGWCIRECATLYSLYDVDALYNFAVIPRRTRSTINHHACTEVLCTAWTSSNPSSNSTPTLHVADDCACELIGVSTSDVAAIIEQGGIPLVSITHTSEQSVEVKLEKWDWFTPYTAISHVWADGLGNTRSNQLPKCRLLEMQHTLSNMSIEHRLLDHNPFLRSLASRKHWFWMDSFCIPAISDDEDPVSKTRYEKAKILAIDNMNNIYTQALPTLVLDAEMRTLSKEMHPATLMVYASHCGWTTRGWTLQEGSLSRRVLFGLCDGTFETKASQSKEPDSLPQIPDIQQRLQSAMSKRTVRSNRLVLVGKNDKRDPMTAPGEVLNFDDLLHIDWSRHKISLQALGDRDDWEADILRVAWNALVHRHTSFPKDIVVILANILGYRACDILASEKPLSVLFGSLRRIPIAFLFNVKGKTDLSEPQPSNLPEPISTSSPFNRWVPTEIHSHTIPAGPAFYSHSEYLRLPRRDTGSGCTVFITRNVKVVPHQFLLQDPRHIESPTPIEALWEDGDLHDLRNLEATAIGFCFLFEGESMYFHSRSSYVKGAALAIIEEDEDEITTVFYCSLLAHAKRDNKQRGLPKIKCSYTGPNFINLLYDRDSLGHAREIHPAAESIIPTTEMGQMLDNTYAWFFNLRAAQLGPVFLRGALQVFGMALTVIALFECAVVLVVSIFVHDDSADIWPYSLGYLVLFTIYTISITTLQAWAHSRRLVRRSDIVSPDTVKSHLLRWAEVLVDYAVNSRFISSLIYSVMSIFMPLAGFLGTGDKVMMYILYGGYIFLLGCVGMAFLQVDDNSGYRNEVRNELDTGSLWETSERDPVLSMRGRYLLANLRSVGEW